MYFLEVLKCALHFFQLMYSRLIDHVLNRERFGHFGEQKLPVTGEHFFRRCDRHGYRITYDRPAKERLYLMQALLPLLLRMRSSEYALLSDLVRMRGNNK